MDKIIVEAIIIGRNDNYEPNWNENLCAAIKYNYRLFEKSKIDFRVCFVEYNPVDHNPLLSPKLTRQFDFLRAVVVPPEFHKKLSTMPKHNIMFNYGYNLGVRTSEADFIIITCGDIFFGSDVASYMCNEKLNKRCMYRAERVSFSEAVDLTNPASQSIEDPNNHTLVSSCTEGSFAEPPYTNACGDFILMDAGSYKALRGYDESIKHSRMHLDSRFCLSAYMVGVEAKLIGRVYHIDYQTSYSNQNDEIYGDIEYNYLDELPYFNSKDWGLAAFSVEEISERCCRLDFHSPKPLCDIQQVNNDLTERLLFKNIENNPSHLISDDSFSIELDRCVLHNNCHAEKSTGQLTVSTLESRFSYAIEFDVSALQDVLTSGYSYRFSLSVNVQQGRVGVCLLKDDHLVTEQLAVKSDGNAMVNFFVPRYQSSSIKIIVRNNDFDRSSIFTIKRFGYEAFSEQICEKENRRRYKAKAEEVL